MQDEQEPYHHIKVLASHILDSSVSMTTLRMSPIRRQASAHVLFTIDESEEYNFDEGEPCFNPQLIQRSLKNEVLIKMACDAQNHYDFYKCLYIQIAANVGKKEKELLKNLNVIMEQKACLNDNERLMHALVSWLDESLISKTKPHSPESQRTDGERRAMFIRTYLYHIALEKVFFEYLGLVDDPILKKLFSQGIVIYALANLYFYNEPQLMIHLNSVGLPLAIRFDNSLLNLNDGKDWSFSRPLRNWTTDYNLYRLTVTRIRRLWLTLNDFHYFKDLSLWMTFCDPVVQAIMRYLNFFYFIPRLATQFLCFFKHLFMYDWLTEQEKAMSVSERFIIQFNRRWEICFRDALWCFNSLMNIFVLVGAYSAWSLLLNASLQGIETGLNIYLYCEFVSHKQKRQDFLFKETPFLRKETRLQIQQMDNLEEKNRYIRMINSILVLVSNILVLKMFLVVSIYIPLIGAVLGVMMSFLQFASRAQLEQQRSDLKEILELPAIYTKEYSFQFFIKNQANNLSASRVNWYTP